MNYERDPDYLSERVCIMPIPEGRFWHKSTQLKKTIAQAIQDLFKTKIIGISSNYVKMDPLMYFVDEVGNRWAVEVEDSKLYAYFSFLLFCSYSELLNIYLLIFTSPEDNYLRPSAKRDIITVLV